VVADEQEARAPLQVALVEGEHVDEVLDPLVGDDAAHEEDVDPAVVVETAGDGRDRTAVVVEVEHDGEHRRPPITRGFQLAAIELAVGQAQLGALGEGGQLRRPWLQPGHWGWNPEEPARGRDVVVMLTSRSGACDEPPAALPVEVEGRPSPATTPRRTPRAGARCAIRVDPFGEDPTRTPRGAGGPG
jgi:hypothetical protein